MDDSTKEADTYFIKFRVATNLENIENLGNSGNLKNCQDLRENSGKFELF